MTDLEQQLHDLKVRLAKELVARQVAEAQVQLPPQDRVLRGVWQDQNYRAMQAEAEVARIRAQLDVWFAAVDGFRNGAARASAADRADTDLLEFIRALPPLQPGAAGADRVDRVRELLLGLLDAFERTIAEADRAPGGMRVPFFGEFAAVVRVPSVIARMRWWVAEFQRALSNTFTP